MKFLWFLFRILMGWLFLWAFIDKTLGFSFSTAPEDAWIYGGSPTAGFLQFGARGPFAPFFNAIGGTPLVNWLYMAAMLALGLSLIFGLLVRFSSIIGTLVLALMYLAAMPPATNPFIDYHILYILILIGIFAANAGKYFGLDYFIFRKKAPAGKKKVVVEKKQVEKQPVEEKKNTAPKETLSVQEESTIVEPEPEQEVSTNLEPDTEEEESIQEEQMK